MPRSPRGKYDTKLITVRDLNRINGWIDAIRKNDNTPEEIREIAERALEILARYVYSGRENY